jgi:hypothetical protein
MEFSGSLHGNRLDEKAIGENAAEARTLVCAEASHVLTFFFLDYVGIYSGVCCGQARAACSEKLCH